MLSFPAKEHVSDRLVVFLFRGFCLSDLSAIFDFFTFIIIGDRIFLRNLSFFVRPSWINFQFENGIIIGLN